MLKKIEKFENLINQGLEKLISLWFIIMHKILPISFFEYKKQLKLKSIQKKKQFKNQIIEFLQKIKQTIIDRYQKIIQFQEKLNTINPKDKIKEWALNKKSRVQNFSPKSLSVYLFNCLKQVFNSKLVVLITGTSTKQIFKVASALVVIVCGAIGVYKSSIEIYQAEFPYREPASVQEYDYRPDYLLYKRKSVKFFNIKLPLTVKSVSDIDSITIDFSVRTSTRWARYFLENYEYKLKDYFFTTVEPVVSHFPLEEEGKEVLKRKIKLEVDNFLRENGVEGNVEEVRIIFIIAS